ncbi:hypothetical protein SADUNF_Sadunf10G0063700 [Salix dunnii]|uniref:Uncharacterized protein n=1 Tax=Salix dunnii TaxID=1413687 RepID=A0A835MQB9_9ROSI|nr:hypothetical protein SADUNF_Sadunf10G0063700 [Salix dunnii]
METKLERMENPNLKNSCKMYTTTPIAVSKGIVEKEEENLEQDQSLNTLRDLYSPIDASFLPLLLQKSQLKVTSFALGFALEQDPGKSSLIENRDLLQADFVYIAIAGSSWSTLRTSAVHSLVLGMTVAPCISLVPDPPGTLAQYSGQYSWHLVKNWLIFSQIWAVLNGGMD